MDLKVLISKLLVLVFIFPLFAHAELKQGDTLKTLANLHPDPSRRVLYSLNYQLQGGLIPVCSDVVIKKVKKKKIVFTWGGLDYEFAWEGHTKKAGVSLMQVAETFFGSDCNQARIDKMSEKDREGIRKGEPLTGMTREGVLVAMGRPPWHVNPSLDAASFTYWRNKFARTIIEFDEQGMVSSIR